MKHRKKRINYNPLKMTGSWLSGIIATFFFIIYVLASGAGNELWRKISLVPLLPIAWLYNILTKTHLPLLGLLTIYIYGFLVGWGIESLYRRLRK